MIGKQTLSVQRIIDGLYSDYGIELKSLEFLPIGADVNATVYKGYGKDLKPYFIKIKQGHYDGSVEIAKWLFDVGIESIIVPIRTLQNKLTSDIEDFTLIVYPFIEGKDGFSCALTASQWKTLGKALRQMHEVDVPLALQKNVRKEIFSTHWQDQMRSLYSHLEKATAHDELALKTLLFMQEHFEAIQRLVNRAEILGQTLKSQSLKFVLCHSDIHGGNVLLNGPDMIYIVDWDDLIMAPKERDLMFIGGGVANVWNKLEDEKLFYQGYGKVEVNAIALAYYRHVRIVEDMAIYGQYLLQTKEASNRGEMYQHFVDMFEQSGVVEIAFKTDIDYR